jgi:hypothetical protein
VSITLPPPTATITSPALPSVQKALVQLRERRDVGIGLGTVDHLHERGSEDRAQARNQAEALRFGERDDGDRSSGRARAEVAQRPEPNCTSTGL